MKVTLDDVRTKLDNEGSLDYLICNWADDKWINSIENIRLMELFKQVKPLLLEIQEILESDEY